nr:Chain C, PROTEIN (SENDAI VIRUS NUCLEOPROTEIN) [synthetic construct]1FZK_P Chain P, PROTEIN (NUCLEOCAPSID PROTEIN) [synthetic construct]1FZO_P Chain P, PROTEIN (NUCLEOCAPSID PROTEIN) [synthetic construct]1KPV_P Chain P, Nucleocapsid protein [synthetic construct]2CII_C Chain C, NUCLEOPROTEIN [Human respirovirus 1]2VAB_P Chain P, SENDAI VIRUS NUCLEOPROTEIN [Respirovirus muris]4PG9_C Chain C, Sendai virus nucleoprotein [Respirovirus muris]
FAPGNYPAL